MSVPKYSVNQYPVQVIIGWVKTNQIAIPDIQRPFVWSSSQVRDFIDSLYQGYPVGYLISWRNPSIRLKNGSVSGGKNIIIDGQQRITALMAAFVGERVINQSYKHVHIKIAFHPIEERFEVLNPAIQNDKSWIPDISNFLGNVANLIPLAIEYSNDNKGFDQSVIFANLTKLANIMNNQIGIIQLESELDIDTVTEIFIRINSKGKTLSQADFVMSKIASDANYGGNMLRKAIDYFCHMAVDPPFCNFVQSHDQQFASSNYFNSISWLRNEISDIYDPTYTDLLRVLLALKFKRGRLKDLVALISGRNFVTRDFEEEIAENTFKELNKGYFEFVNQTNFKNFVMIIESAGFIDSKLITSHNTLNFAYFIYLYMRDQGLPQHEIQKLTRKWYVMSVLKARYMSSAESMFEQDIRRIEIEGVASTLKSIENAELSDSFWDFGLPQDLVSSSNTNPSFLTFLAAQALMQDKGFLSDSFKVDQLLQSKGDVHHIFPKEFLKSLGFAKTQYNQVANYVMTQTEINIAIGKQAPNVYMEKVIEQCKANDIKSPYGGIADIEALKENLRQNCIPDSIFDKNTQYQVFLDDRRKLMAQKIKDYYHSL